MPIHSRNLLTESHNLPRKGVIICIDWGCRRTGIALTDEAQILSLPYSIYVPTIHKTVEQQILECIYEKRAVGLLIGWPLNMNSTEGEQCFATAEFITNLTKLLCSQKWSGSIAKYDERCSSIDAQTQYGAHAQDDAMAAMVILKNFLESRALSDKFSADVSADSTEFNAALKHVA